MQRIALLILTLGLSGCGYQTWWNPPLTAGFNPNLPANDSENMLRAQGQEPSVPPLTTEPGDIWPGPLAQPPTLKDMEAAGGQTNQQATTVPGGPMNRGTAAPFPSPNPGTGSSTPPGYARPGLAAPQPSGLSSSYAAPPAAPPDHGPAGKLMQTQQGTESVTGGGPGYQTTVSPGGGQSIVVPNGNGTATVIHADGRIETIPTPK